MWLLQDLCGVELALGSVTACEAGVSQAGRRGGGPRGRERLARGGAPGLALWVAATATVAMFLVHARRGVVAAQAPLGGSPAS